MYPHRPRIPSCRGNGKSDRTWHGIMKVSTWVVGEIDGPHRHDRAEPHRGATGVTGWYRLAWPLLRLIPPEAAHRLAVVALARGLVPVARGPELPALATRVWGLDFANPIGLAAGFDKDAEAIDALGALGFGFVEVGGVTPRAQPGNPRPRLFRLPEDGALINRLGLNNRGLAAMAERLDGRRRSGIVGVNVAANADSTDAVADYVAGLEALHSRVDYLAVNVSSPNTPGLRELQGWW